MLTVTDLSKSYGSITALNELNLSIKKNQVYALLGPNGSGKSTTLGILLTTLKASSGNVTWNNKSTIGALLEKPCFYQYLSAIDNLRITCKIKNTPEENINWALDVVGLYSRAQDKVRTYSMGMRQRLGIAAAIVNKPDLLILDEPTNGLDPQGIAEVRAVIKDLHNKGVSIILASHLLSEVQQLCTHLCILKKGAIVFEGSFDSLTQQKVHKIEIGSSNLDELERKLQELDYVFKIIKDPNQAFLRIEFSLDRSMEDISNHLNQIGIMLNHLRVQEFDLEAHYLKLVDQ